MKAWVLLGLAGGAIGCTIPAEKELIANCGKNVCLQDQVCDKTDPAGPTCIPADGDIDNDGIPNSKDFCDHMAGGDTDEDGDGIGDVCDPCPIAPPPAHPDADGDAVDSPCDPDPDTPGDTILFFDGFRHGLTPQYVAGTPADWTTQDGELLATPGTSVNLESISIGITPRPNLAVLASYRVDKVDATTTDHTVVVGAVDSRPAGVTLMQCGLDHDDGTGNDSVLVHTDQGTVNQPASNAFDTSRLYELASYSTGGSVGCTAIADGAGLGVAQAAITPDQLPQVTLSTRATDVRFEWILVVGRP